MPKKSAPVAVCLFPLPSQQDGTLSKIQVFPAGEFSVPHGAMRGTGPWRLDQAAANALMARVASRKTPLVIDYEHQSLLAAGNGQPAPAAGWVLPQDLRWTESGLFAQASWTDRAKQMIAAGEYRYLSPVFTYEKGVPTDLLNLALTNNPAIDGMQPVMLAAASRFTQSETKPMLHAAVTALLGIAENADDAAIVAACNTIQEKLAAGEAAVAAAKAAPNPAEYAPVAALTALQTELAALRASHTEREIADLVDPALADGRLLAAQEQWARNLGKSDLAALKSYLATAQPIAALKGSQTGGKPPEVGNPPALTEEEIAVCRQLGLDRAAFVQSRTQETA